MFRLPQSEVTRMNEPYWMMGAPVTMRMPPQVFDLCSACGHCRDRHQFLTPKAGQPTRFGTHCIHPKCQCSVPSSYRRCVGPEIIETHTANGQTVNLPQPTYPRGPIHPSNA